MKIHIRLVDGPGLLRKYIFLPKKLYSDDPRWVPPFYADEWDFHNPKRNKALQYCEVIRFMAFHESQAVGRIMGIIHTPYNNLHNEKTARFYNLDCINSQEAVHNLLEAIEQWALEKGMNKLIGPFGFSDKDPQGFQIEGFEYLPILATATNPEYLPRLVVQEGYSKEVDCVSYHMDVPDELPEYYRNIYERVSQNTDLRLMEFLSRKQLKPYIIPVLELVNEAYSPIFGFAPMNKEEMRKFASQYLPVIDPHFVKLVVTRHHELIGFVVAIPEMSKGIQKAKGRLFPFGFIHILRAMRNTTQLNLMLGAVKERFRRKGVGVLMGTALLRSAAKKGFRVIDSHLILETNIPMRGECEKLSGRLCKRYRIFSKSLK
jgi:GNAT superfamily N-acetyltransferase